MVKRLIVFALASLALPVLAVPLPPGMRGADATDASGPINVKVRRIEQIQQISTTAPAPKTALAGEHRVLVVLVETADRKFSKGNAKLRYQQIFFGEGVPSVADYYEENSHGLYALRGEVIGPISVPSRITDFQYGAGGNNARVHELIKQVFSQVSGSRDLKGYDTHNRFGQLGRDGFIDHFGVIFPAEVGKHEDIFAPIWPHRGTITHEANGWRLGSYFIFSQAVPLGGMVHEFGHDIGLPDLYDRDDSSHGVGAWCTMASGSWLGKGDVPAHISAWGKIKMGWLRPTIMSRSQARVEIPAAETTPFAIKIPIGRIDSPEYFLVENRQKIGYDSLLPDHGLMVWHVNEDAQHNDDETAKLIDVEEPTPTQDLDVNYRRTPPDGLDTFRAGRQDTFDQRSDPASLTKAGKPSGVAISNISRSGAVMLADFAVPTIRDPGGEPYRLLYDNYNFGAFSNVLLGSGGEKFVRFDATPGGYEIHGFEALLMSRPGARADLTLRVYKDAKNKPGKQLYAQRISKSCGSDSYAWLKVRIEDPEGLRLQNEQRFWVGIEHHDAYTGLTHNPASNSGRSFFRMSRKAKLRDTFGPGRPVPDFVMRVQGFGFIGLTNPSLPEQADDTDALIVKMREVDAVLDAKEFAEAKQGYEALLPQMEAASARYSTWIPVLHNSLGVAAYQAKDFDTAVDLFKRSLSRAQLAADRRAEADILENIGETLFHAGKLVKAAEYCARSETLNADRPGRLIENVYWLGRIAHARGQAAEASRYLDRVMPLVERVFATLPEDHQRWQGRVERARAGTAVGEDLGEGEAPRMVQEREEERAIESGEVKEEDTGIWKIDLADFGL